MRLHLDDPVHRFQGRLIDLRGTPVFFQARYTAYGVFIATTPVAVGVLLLGGVATGRAILYGVLLGLLITAGVMRFVDGDLTLRAVSTAYAAEARHLTRARLRRHDRPRRVTLARAHRKAAPDAP